MERQGLFLLLLGPLIFLILFFFFPLAGIFFQGITDDSGSLSVSGLADLICDPYYLGIIAFTVKQALLSTLLSLLMGLPGAYFLACFDFKGKNIVRAVTTVPFVLPSILVVLGFVRFYGHNGALNRLLISLFALENPPLKILYSLGAILLAHAFYNMSICIRLVSSVWSRSNPHIEEAARTLGARGSRLFFRITLPQIMPGILASAVLIFIFCFMSFAIILVLGGGPRFTTLEVEVYRLAKVNLAWKMATRLAMIGSSLSLLFLYIYTRLQHRLSFAESREYVPRRKLAGLFKGPYGISIALYFGMLLVFVLGPMLAVIHYSFLSRFGWAGKISFSLKWYAQLFFSQKSGSSSFSLPYLKAIGNSIFFSIMTAALSLPLGTTLAYITARQKLLGKHGLQSLLMLPMGVSSIILGLSYLSAYRKLPIELLESRLIIVFAHTIIAYPFVIRAVASVLAKIKPSLSEAARSLGATPLKAFLHVELPLIKPGIITGAAFAFAISIGEINATLMLSNPDLITIPIAIYRLISSYNFFAACVMGTVLMLVSFIAFFVIDRMGTEVF